MCIPGVTGLHSESIKNTALESFNSHMSIISYYIFIFYNDLNKLYAGLNLFVIYLWKQHSVQLFF